MTGDPAPSSPKTTTPQGMLPWTTHKKVAVGGVAAGILGVFLPWGSVTIVILTVNINGIDTGDGKLTLAVLVVAALCLLLAKSRGVLIAALVASVIAAALCIYEVANINSITSASGAGVGVSVGYGLYLSVIGSIVAAGALVLLLRDMRPTSA